MGFCITSIVIACIKIIVYSMVLVYYGFVITSTLLLFISIVEVGAAIWGVICSCATVRCCADPVSNNSVTLGSLSPQFCHETSLGRHCLV